MMTLMYFPSPREGLDEGSLAELVQDSREIELAVAQPRPWVASPFGAVEIPEDASALIDGFPLY